MYFAWRADCVIMAREAMNFMHNDLFTIGKLTVHGYGLMIAIGVVLALFLSLYRAKRRGLNADAVESIVLLALVFGFLGAKILFVIVNFKDFLASPVSLLGSEGFVVYGGIVLGVVAVYIYCRRKKISFLAYFDLLVPAVALAQGFGRIGCFLSGCCYGAPTDSFLGIVFPAGSMAPAGVSLWPTQLFSAGGDLLLCGILLLYAKKDRRPGNVGALYLLLYAIGRFIIEIFRADARGSVGALSTSQFISIFIVILAVGLFVWNKKQAEKQPADKPEE